MDLGLSDRVYVVTGAHTAVGRACAQLLAAEGARLVLHGPDDPDLTALAGAVGGSDRAIAVSGDLSEAGLETCLAAAAIARYGRLDGALLLQDPAPGPSFMAADDAAWRIGFEQTFLAQIRMARTVARHVSYEGGSILLTAAPADRHNASGVIATTLNRALVGSVSRLAEELGPRNIRVNGVIPGLLEVPRRAGADPALDDQSVRLLEGIPLQRLGEHHELARPAVFLLSPVASYVSGATLQVDGGLGGLGGFSGF